jgi:hypothetical protein
VIQSSWGGEQFELPADIQFALAKIGVPALFFDDGTDFIGRPAGWGKQKIEEGLFSGWLIAQADAMPTWNPGDEFEPARKNALAAVSK